MKILWNSLHTTKSPFITSNFVTRITESVNFRESTHHNHSNSITTLEANQKNNLEKLDKIDDLCRDVLDIKGLLDEYLKE